MKKTVILILVLCLILPTISVLAAEEETSFCFSLQANGKDIVEVEKGDVITVVFTLHRTDKAEPYTMYAMQNEIRYDSTFFELVEGSIILNEDIQSTDIAMVDQYRELYMNYLSMTGGVEWEPETMVGSFQLKVVGDAGVTQITCEDYLVSYRDGSGSYDTQAEDLTVVLSTDCLVKFESNGGTKVDEQKIIFGEKVERPADPVREGYALEGWFRDIHLTKEWNFDQDTVDGNMTLYAKWEAVTEEPTQPTEPTEPATDVEEDPDSPSWLLPIAAVIVIVLVVVLVVFKKKPKKEKRQ